MKKLPVMATPLRVSAWVPSTKTARIVCRATVERLRGGTGKPRTEGLEPHSTRLALMYRDGRGVTRNAAQAISWFRKAADRGEADAQIELGILLSPGHGKSTDIVEAHTWLNLAASRWKDEAKRLQAGRLRDELEKAMTDDQRAQAYRRATEWQDAHAWPIQSAASK